MVRQRRARRNRRVPSRPRTAVARIANGLPFKPRRVRSDPPEMPVSLTQSLRLRFNIVAAYVPAASGKYTIVIAKTPLSPNCVFLQFGVQNGAIASAFELKQNDVVMALFMALYGVQYKSSTTDVNVLSTEFAIQKVTLYGPSDGLSSREISLQVDFGGSPGFIARDIGDRNKRAVIAARTPRMTWYYCSSADSTFLRADMGTLRNPMLEATAGAAPPKDWASEGNVVRWDAGCLDISLCVRRAFVPKLSTAPERSAATSYGTTS